MEKFILNAIKTYVRERERKKRKIDRKKETERGEEKIYRNWDEREREKERQKERETERARGKEKRYRETEWGSAVFTQRKQNFSNISLQNILSYRERERKKR